MTKSDIIHLLKECKAVAVIRGNSLQKGLDASVACIKGTLGCIEVAYTNNEASTIIKQLTTIYKDNKTVCIGAGTVLDAITAKDAITAGAKYIVAPSFSQETATLCNRYGIPYIPGCMTITEIVTAMESGCELIKLFPGSAFGPGYISAIKAPLPQVSIMVTGGVNLDNAKEWFASGVDVIGIGGEINKLAANGKFSKITAIAKQYIKIC